MVIIFVLVLVSLTKIARLRTCTYFFGSAASQCFWAPPLVCLSVGIVSTKTNMWQCRFDCPMGHGTDLPPHKTLPCCIVITVDKINACVLLCVFRYWFCKDIDKHWLPVGCNFRRFVNDNDIKRVWPGPGLNGLQLWQIGVSLPIEDLTEPCRQRTRRRCVLTTWGYLITIVISSLHVLSVKCKCRTLLMTVSYVTVCGLHASP